MTGDAVISVRNLITKNIKVENFTPKDRKSLLELFLTNPKTYQCIVQALFGVTVDHIAESITLPQIMSGSQSS
jgi:hypothetical protein